MRAALATLFFSLLALLGLVLPLPARAADPALDRIESDFRDGLLDADTALEFQLLRAFASEELPEPYRGLAARPLRCATPVLMEARRRGDRLPARLRERLATWLAPAAGRSKRAAYLSPSGHFQLDYEITGSNAVPLDDLSPANGIPDFVERVAQYFDQSWAAEFESLSFVPPNLSGGPYRVSFESMNAYGYTVADSTAAGTHIVLHNTFEGFPPNDDPAGSAIGSAKASAAHELKHASQFATSGWSENGLWVEVDATWVEDIVYDEVNDYYNFLTGGSPIAAPGLSLDAGPIASGSYDDCVWQHWMSESWGVGIIEGFWQRRAALPGESVLATYDAQLSTVGASIAENWVDFASWNYACGANAIFGFGYEEAFRYPDSFLAGDQATLPAVALGQVNHLAAAFHRVTGFSNGQSGRVRITLDPTITPTPLRARVLVRRLDGSLNLQALPLGVPGGTLLADPLSAIGTITVVVANGSTSIDAAGYSLRVEEEIDVPMPVAYLGAPSVGFAVESGGQGSRSLTVTNVGDAGSVLDVQAHAAASWPAAPKVARSVAGSSFVADRTSYTPGTTFDIQFTLTNLSADFEWIAGVHLQVPTGVEVLSSTDLVGGTTPLSTTGAVGNGVALDWVDANGSWGNVKNGQSATATVQVHVDNAEYEDLVFDYTIDGDGYGAAPHSVDGTITLVGPGTPPLDLTSPNGGEIFAIGQLVPVQWSAMDSIPVRVELSRDGGASWQALADSVPNTGSWTWAATGPATADARLRLTTVDGALADSSAAAFALIEPVEWLSVTPAQLRLTAGEEAALQLTFDASALLPGAYQASLVLGVTGQASPIVVPVQLTVTSTSTPTPPGRKELEVEGASPNPFNPRTHIRFTLGSATRVRVSIHDARGRRVAVLADRVFDAGPHRLTWEGLDAQGSPVASGAYFYHVETDRRSATGKMMLVK